jgi:hypothetical protein
VPLIYKGVRGTPAYEADVVVEDCVIVEVKAVEALHPIYEQQLLTYLRLADCRVGLVLNFGGATLKRGFRRVVNNFPEDGGEDTNRRLRALCRSPRAARGDRLARAGQLVLFAALCSVAPSALSDHARPTENARNASSRMVEEINGNVVNT